MSNTVYLERVINCINLKVSVEVGYSFIPKSLCHQCHHGISASCAIQRAHFFCLLFNMANVAVVCCVQMLNPISNLNKLLPSYGQVRVLKFECK